MTLTKSEQVRLLVFVENLVVYKIKHRALLNTNTTIQQVYSRSPVCHLLGHNVEKAEIAPVPGPSLYGVHMHVFLPAWVFSGSSGFSQISDLYTLGVRVVPVLVSIDVETPVQVFHALKPSLSE